MSPHTDAGELLPCPFCGSDNIVLWTGFGTQADILCEECCCERNVQVCDLFEIHERPTMDLKTCRYPDAAIERVNKHLVTEWNTRQAASQGTAGGEPVAWLAEYDGHLAVTTQRDTAAQWKDTLGRKVTPLYLHPAQASLPPPVDREELVALLIDLASVNLSHEACERQAKRMADDLIARGLSVPSAHREAGK